MIRLNAKKLIDGVYFLSSTDNQVFNDENYIRLRQKEGRIYSDEELRSLPEISSSHKLICEWDVRKKTLRKLVKYFKKQENTIILEVGCGNGWLSNAISQKTNNYVVGLDLNQYELRQASRVFTNNPRLKLVYGNIFENIFPPKMFDTVILPSSVQYFENLQTLIKRIFYFLKPEGEIHIVDSNFYSANKVNAAKLRSQKYFKELGFPDTSSIYNHHKWSDLKKYNYKTVNNFSLIMGKITKQVVFPWIIIKGI